MENRLHRECAEILLGRYNKSKSKVFCKEVQSAKEEMGKNI